MKMDQKFHIEKSYEINNIAISVDDSQLLSKDSNIALLACESFLKQGFWEFDMIGGSYYFSPGMYKIFGTDSINGSGSLFSVVQDLMKILNLDELKCSTAEDSHARKEFEIVDGIGNRKRIEAFGKVLQNDQFGEHKFVGVIRDISKLKEYEKALEVKVDELNRSNKELEEFVHIASHDLYEPLRKISTFGQRLIFDAQKELSDKNLDYLNRMLKATDNMRQLIDHLLDYSKVSRGAVIWDDVNLNKIVSEVLGRQELRIEETSAQIHVEVLATIQAVPVLMMQLFDNVIGNALKFQHKDRRPQIEISSYLLGREEKLKYKLLQNMNYHQISVKDNGIGFENIYADKIFQLFQRLNGKTDFSGSGIGLAICRKITDVHNGIIFSESKPDKGSVFHIILPEKQ